jgi:hypothetical protein
MSFIIPTTETATPSFAEDDLAPLVNLDVTHPSIGSSDQVANTSDLASSSDVVVVSGDLTNHFLAPSLGDCLIDLHSDSTNFPPLSGPLVNSSSTIDPQSVVAAALQGLNPSQIKNLFGDTIQSVFRDAIASLKPSIIDAAKPEISDVPGRRSYAKTVAKPITTTRSSPTVSTTVAPVVTTSPSPTIINTPVPMVVDEDGFQIVTRRPFTNTYPTIDHPNLRRTSYTMFRFSDPINRSSQLFHVGQILIFCTASARILINDFNPNVLPAGYLAFANAFNDGARLTSKRFATFNTQTGVPIFVPDPINIFDFRIDRDYIRALERTSPRLVTPSLLSTLLVERSLSHPNLRMNPNSGSMLTLPIPNPPPAVTKPRTNPRLADRPTCSTDMYAIPAESQKGVCKECDVVPI